MKWRVLILVFALLGLNAGAAIGLPPTLAPTVVPTWNSGYNGWSPGGFGYPPVTVQAPSVPCSVTAYGPTFNVHSGGGNQDYGGGVSCASGVGEKTLTIYDQVLGADGHTWFTIAGSAVNGARRSGNPLRMIRNRPAYLGHVYRTAIVARLVVPNGRAGCSLTHTCSRTIVLSATGRPLDL